MVLAAASFGVGNASTDIPGSQIPQRGDRIRRVRAGISVAGTVHYSDQLQILVKWDDGDSSSLRVGRDRFTGAAFKAVPHDESAGATAA